MDLRGSRAWVQVGAGGWVSARPHARPPAAGPCCALWAAQAPQETGTQRPLGKGDAALRSCKALAAESLGGRGGGAGVEWGDGGVLAVVARVTPRALAEVARVTPRARPFPRASSGQSAARPAPHIVRPADSALSAPRLGPSSEGREGPVVTALPSAGRRVVGFRHLQGCLGAGPPAGRLTSA